MGIRGSASVAAWAVKLTVSNNARPHTNDVQYFHFAKRLRTSQTSNNARPSRASQNSPKRESNPTRLVSGAHGNASSLPVAWPASDGRFNPNRLKRPISANEVRVPQSVGWAV